MIRLVAALVPRDPLARARIHGGDVFDAASLSAFRHALQVTLSGSSVQPVSIDPQSPQSGWTMALPVGRTKWMMRMETPGAKTATPGGRSAVSGL